MSEVIDLFFNVLAQVWALVCSHWLLATSFVLAVVGCLLDIFLVTSLHDDN